ncbi:MmcQ/YjbR family DNA-binding protein [Nocardiopsis sp. L17-MgMaSL7]|uniref:MmcQ/YjbR family DNA-binding protein n=1 Tax=Nocardiopsis sp. L17-MgMaSL7 TaxID=1938893 RepID=UPI000D7099CB|nr:MmcQ/YjbR family DNA-binding protein [Nocardiopsis sp. L17-MgMaSL7]PWV55060.1 putative DNA-binding protein (MmcQ/YjbR family) [Nocardiopsis sp. L17-MgMaSL7]
MDGKALQEAAEECAQNLPETTVYSFEPGWEAFRVHERWFMLMTEVPRHSRVRDARVVAGQPVVIVKADPSDATTLREAYADIVAGYHMNKRHWITLAPGDSIDTKLVEELVTESYRLVLDTLPRSRQPADPEARGSSTRG